MAQTKTTIGSGTKIVGQVTSEEDLAVAGSIEGGPLRVRGRLTVAAGGAVSCDDTEVGEALVIGVFTGTLRARDIVRIHTSSGRVLGEIMAARVTFVSDQAVAALQGEQGHGSSPAAAAAAPAAAPVATPAPRSTQPIGAVVQAPAPAAEAPAAAPPAAAAAPAGASGEITGSMAMPHAEPPAAPPSSESSPRTIPSLPSLGQRAIQRKE